MRQGLHGQINDLLVEMDTKPYDLETLIIQSLIYLILCFKQLFIDEPFIKTINFILPVSSVIALLCITPTYSGDSVYPVGPGEAYLNSLLTFWILLWILGLPPTVQQYVISEVGLNVSPVTVWRPVQSTKTIYILH